MDAYEQFLAGIALYREARGESKAARAAVLAVIINRAAIKKTTLDRIILAPWQFSSFNAKDPNAVAWPDRTKPLDWAAYLDCCAAVNGAMELYADPTGGATHYYDDSIAKPAWATQMEFKGKIGRFNFYKGKF